MGKRRLTKRRSCYTCSEAFKIDYEGGRDREGNMRCDRCYHDIVSTCTFCEEYFPDPESPEETFFNVGPDEAQYAKPGVYKVLRYPYTYGNILTGFESFFERNIEKVAESPKNWKGEDYTSGTICEDCFKSAIAKAKGQEALQNG